MDNTSAKVKLGTKLSEPFQLKAGVKQGAGLPATLFNIALHSVSVTNKTDRKGTLFPKSGQLFAYADYLVIVTRDVNTLKSIYLELEY
jgi:hypothetical protein